MQLVIHSPFGSRINRAWGLALRKRFCLKFNFELQAAATEDAIVLSLSTSHSFDARGGRALSALQLGARRAGPGDARRADVRGALALDRGHRRSRCRAFAAARRCRRRCSACAPTISWRRCSRTRSPAPRTSSASARFPTIRSSARRCTIACTRRWTSTGSSACLRGIEAGAIAVVARDLPTPSPLALEILTARPYAYLDDAPLEERRTQAVMARRWLDRSDRRATGPARRGRDRARARGSAGRRPPTPTSCTTRCSARRSCVRRRSTATIGWPALVDALIGQRRATLDRRSATSALCVAAERLPQFAVDPSARDARAVDRRARRVSATSQDARGGAASRSCAARLDGLRAGHGARRSRMRSAHCPPTSTAALASARKRRRRDERPLHARRAARPNGAIAGCWRASIATRSSGCARRSSRSRRRTSCASCCAGSTSSRPSAARGRTRSMPSSRSCRASKRRRPRGKPRFCRRASTTTTSRGSTISACRDARCGRA